MESLQELLLLHELTIFKLAPPTIRSQIHIFIWSLLLNTMISQNQKPTGPNAVTHVSHSSVTSTGHPSSGISNQSPMLFLFQCDYIVV